MKNVHVFRTPIIDYKSTGAAVAGFTRLLPFYALKVVLNPITSISYA
ncbi:MAG: hypothetical protein ABR568_14500 [Pyrinomonadaceae bacterium]